MDDRIQDNLQKIDDLWALHLCRDANRAGGGRCLVFATDRRYLETDQFPGLQFRVGVSFGHNPFTPEMRPGFALPPIFPGEFVFGLHLIANKDRQLTLYGQWEDAREAGNIDDGVHGAEGAKAILESLSDEDYLASVRTSPKEIGPLRISELWQFRDFEVVEAEAF